MKIYILRADGPLAVMDGSHTLLCGKAYLSKPAAEGKQQSFRKACVTPKDEWDLVHLEDCEQLKIRILELDLQNGDEAC